MNIKDEFVSKCDDNYKWRLGKGIASSLTGFLVGIAATVIFFLAFFDLALKS